ncbi:MAG TPA: sugar transferase [Puia sp.]|jgi:lipopolysaccharide/colanic/teichoic acid biosynthesis glycosyltransferase|nr:sugar transferase [Puia sp.]
MDLLFLPQAEKKDQRTAPRITFRSYHLPKAGNLQYSGFYYIGKNTAHIEKLVGVYKRGYASEGLDNVKAELLRSLQQEKNMLPEVILCEARFDFAAIRHFSQFLRQHPVLNSIPFILDGSGLSGDDLWLYKKNTRPDEILFLQNCDDRSLKLKIQFLRKVKAGGQGAPVPRIEENLQQQLHIGQFFKRSFDMLAAAVALVLLSPLFLLIALAIRLESRGPIFYIAKRAGRGYKIFDFYKFRTMQVGSDKKMSELTHLNQYNAETQGPVFFKINNDPRITRVGTFLRNTSLDELPQLFNVFLGDMSLVGNRPLPLYEAETLTTDNYAARFMAPAGITGLWQIKKRGNKDMSVEERINIDIAYASNCNFATDLRIIANTPFALLQKENV